MCTSIVKDRFFGRTLDLELNYNESVIITPRNYSLPYKTKEPECGYGIIGIGILRDGFPLYFDAVNEMGLGVAALNFNKSSVYFKPKTSKLNLASFEIIPYILSHCKDVKEAETLLKKTNILNLQFDENMPNSGLHWLIADKNCSIVAESNCKGLNIYSNPVGVLTNEPEFNTQLFSLNNYIALSSSYPTNNFSKEIALSTYSKGLGALGLPGDYSSNSRFVKASFVKLNYPHPISKPNEIFEIFSTVSVPRGSVLSEDGKIFSTIYTSVYNLETATLYYKTADSLSVWAVNLNRKSVDSENITCYAFEKETIINYQN